MAKKRLIFTLHYDSGFFNLSRNFRLQKAGDLNWLNKNYNFPQIAFSIDELVVLDVSRKERNAQKFKEILKELAKGVFVPIASGGGIRTLSDAKDLFESGADKIVLNTILLQNSEVVEEIAHVYGAQSIVASIDYSINENGVSEIYIENGSKNTGTPLVEYINKVNALPVGEIYLHSMKQDGTGQGFDIDTLNQVSENFRKPLILSGGAGNGNHLEEGLKNPFCDAVSTANLFNFIGTGLPNARNYLLEKGINLPRFIKLNEKL